MKRDLLKHMGRRCTGRLRAFAICVVAAVLVGVPLVAPAAPAAAQVDYAGTWAPIRDMLKARNTFGAATGPCPAPPEGTGSGQCVYAVGATTTTDGNLMAEYYDPATPGTGWQDLPRMIAPLGRGTVAAAAGADGRIYAFGTNLYDMVSVEAYDPVLNMWEPVPPPVNSPRNGLAAVSDNEGRIYVLGGGVSGASANVEVYDPREDVPTWRTVAPMTQPRSRFGAAVGSDGRIYAVGGNSSDRGSVEAYDPATDTWSGVPSLTEQASGADEPAGREGAAVARSLDGRIYAMGGEVNNVDGAPRYRSTVNVYDPSNPNQGWAPVAPMEDRRGNAAATLGPDGRIYALGGSNGDVFYLQSAEAYTPGAPLPYVPPPPDPLFLPDTWETGTPMNNNRVGPGAAAGIGADRRIYAIGGSIAYNLAGSATDSVEAYDIQARKWESLPRMSAARQYPGAATDRQGRIYSIGGLGNPLVYLNSVERFDPANPDGGWTPVAPMTVPRSNLAAVTGPDGRIYAIGGNASSAHDTVEAYDPATNTWTLVASLSVARSDPIATTRGDLIYVAAGNGDATSVESYDYRTNTWAPGDPVAVGRNAASAATGSDGRLYVIGGITSPSTVEVYDPSESDPVWGAAAPTRVGRQNAAAATAVDRDGETRIFLMGGSNSSGNLKSMEIYTPGPSGTVVDPVDTGPIVTPPFVEYRIDEAPGSIARGPDGNVWFTAQGHIGRMTPAGEFSYWPTASSTTLSDITTGPDGNLWFTGPVSNKIGRITPSGQITEFTLPLTLTPLSTNQSGPQRIVQGPDGAMWFTHAGANRIGRITTTGQVTDYMVSTPASNLQGIAAGPDGNLWFTETAVPKLGRITPGGVITEYEFAEPAKTAGVSAPVGTGGGALDITAAYDRLWFVVGASISEITPGPDPAASVKTYPIDHGEDALDSGPSLQRVTTGADGAVWVADQNGGNWPFAPTNHYLLRITPLAPTVRVEAFRSPATTDYQGEPSTARIGDIAPDGPQMVFTETVPNGIGRFDPRGATPTFSYRAGVAEGEPGEHCVGSGDLGASQARTQTKSCTINSAGPLTDVIVSPWLNCQVWHVDDTAGEHYVDRTAMPPDRAGDGECGTFLVADDKLYGPKNVPCFYWWRDNWEPPQFDPDSCANSAYGPSKAPDQYFELIEQNGVFGAGTVQDPYRIVTKVRAGDMIVTQTDSYIVGRQTYRTDVEVTNTSDHTSDLLLTRAGDCWLNNSDSGNGSYNPATGAVACTSDPGYKNSVATDPEEGIQAQMIEWTPISPGSNWATGDREGVWHLVGYKEPFPSSCVDGNLDFNFEYSVWGNNHPVNGNRTEPGGAPECDGENGAGLSWNFGLAPGESQTRSHYTTFSPYGNTVASISDAAPVTEPATGEVNAAFTVKLAHTSGRPVILEYTAADGSAKGDQDYVPTTGRVEFKPGELSKTVTVAVKGDGVAEESEDFSVVIRDPDDKIVDDPTVNDLGRPDVNPDNPGGSGFVNSQPVLISRDRATGIIDDIPFLEALDAEVTDEPLAGRSSANFGVRLRGRAAPGPVTVAYATSDGTAMAGVDYQATSGTLSFEVGETEKSVAVPVLADAIAGEEEETILLDLSDSAMYIARPRAQGAIRDAVAPSSLRVGDISVTEPLTGSVSARFTVALDEPAVVPVTVDYSTVDGSAKAGSDYAAASGQVTIAAGEQVADLTVAVLGDTLAEAAEDFDLQLSNPTGATLADGRATATIFNAEETPGGPTPPALSIGGVTVTEGDQGEIPAVFNVTLDRPATEAVTVEYATADGSATGRDDYRAASGTLNFAPGEQSKTVAVGVRGDTEAEQTEDFAVVLSNPTGARLAGATGAGVIRDDDETPVPEGTRDPEPRRGSPVPGRDDPVVPLAFAPLTPALPPLAAAPLAVAPPQPITQPITQAQAQQQAQQQNQQQQQKQQQQQQQQQAQQQAQAQAQGQAQAQAQAQVGMATDRQREVRVEGAYAGSTEGTSRATTPVFGWVAALLGAGVALARRPGSSPAPAPVSARSRPVPPHRPQRRRR